MKKIISILFSTRLMAMILVVFFVSIATATFLENDYGTPFAWKRVYNAPWFNVLLFTGIVNLLGVIIKNKLYRKEKFSIFLFHISFVLILAGAAITRFIGYEGTMYIREGQATNQFFLSGDYITLTATLKDEDFSLSIPVVFSAETKNKASINLNTGQQTIKLKLLRYLPNAELSFEPVKAGGNAMAEIVVSGISGMENILLKKGEISKIKSLLFSFESTQMQHADVLIFKNAESLFFKAAFNVEKINMMNDSVQNLLADTPHPFIPSQLYNFNGVKMVLAKYYPQAIISATPSQVSNNDQAAEAIKVKISSGDLEADVWVWKNSGNNNTASFQLGDIPVQISYGQKIKKLPFSLALNDFRLERYPGSNSPSSYESRVTVIDTISNVREQKRIFMNNILKYKGFRFYQSSYETDEKGTVLSVNHDLAGTVTTYAGYLLMALGMILSLMNKKSRFRFLSKETVNINRSKKLLAGLILLIALPLAGFSLPAEQQALIPVDAAHAARFGKLLIQDMTGRIEPINTLSSDLLRKIYRKDQYRNMNSDQVFLGMIINPAGWQNEPIIYCSHLQVQRLLGGNKKYFSYNSFFRGDEYILQPYAEKAYRKKPANRSKFDNEVIRLDERLNIVYMILNGDFLRLFPLPADSNQTWHTSTSAQGHFSTKDSVFVKYILPLYAEEFNKSLKSGNWSEPDRLIADISKYQAMFGSSIIPSVSKQRLEILLNKLNVFDRISGIYGLVGFLLLLYQFIGMFWIRIKNKIPVAIATSIIILLFIIHTLGLAGRWYVSGHAPWSNGYEALTYIAWATILAGIVFARRSAITLSVTSVLSFLILFTAHLSWMDPQITNLVPVLKSYWLVIHVAIITASYGFLGLGALLASVNLLLMLFQNRKNFRYIDLSIHELSNILEMTLIVGLYMLTIGTFLGGVWANESWGRYWGWDAKETWALATVIVYAFIAHMRMIPGMKGHFAFNLAALLGFGSVIMTYFGVNFYLSGLHSYAKGDQLPVPAFIYYTLTVITIVVVVVYLKQRKLKKEF